MANDISSISRQNKYGHMSRTILRKIKDFLTNSSLIFVWLVLTASSNHLPRPNYIFVKLLFRLDNYLFYTRASFVGSVTFIFCLLGGSWLLYKKYYSRDRFIPPNFNYNEEEQGFRNHIMEEDVSNSSYMKNFNYSKLKYYLKENKSYRPYFCWSAAPPILLASSWFIINFLYGMKDPINKAKNIVSELFVVLFHFLVPIIIGLWLFLFHPPGSLKIYALSMGFQNIMVLLTNIVFPNSPPVYIKLHGENKAPTYDMIFTDGLVTEDMKVGENWYRAIYFASPNKFASMPSIHSSMGSLIFFFVSFYSRYTLFKLLALAYLFAQWWSALYLDLHWRLDLIVGLFYSIITFTFIRNWKLGLPEIDRSFMRARLRRNYQASSTIGMRLFKNTRFQKNFDPLA